MRQIKSISRTKFLPIRLLANRKNQYHMNGSIISIKSFDGTHQNRLPTYRQKLLGNLSSHPQAFSTCNNDDMFLHVHALIIMPDFNSFTFSIPQYFSTMEKAKSIAAPGPFAVMKLPSVSTKAAVYSAPVK